MPAPFLTQVASSVPYDNTSLANNPITATDVQGALDYLAQGPKDVVAVATTTVSTSSATDVALNAMTVTAPAVGNYLVLFSGQMNANSGTPASITVYSGATAVTDSIRTQVGPAGTHDFILNTMTIINVTNTANAINIKWNSSGSVTCTGRSLAIIKVS